LVVGWIDMDRKRLVDKEIRRRAKKQSKSNSALKSSVDSLSVKVPSTGCIYSEVACQKIDRDGFRPCISSKNEDGSNPKFCSKVPIEARASLASTFHESIKNGDFEDSWGH
jgi:hypothetical protein